MISLFAKAKEKDATPKSNLSDLEYFDGVKNGRWQDEVLNYRIGKLEKINLTCLTPSGVFKIRNISGLMEHSGLICIDVDAKDQLGQVNIELLKQDNFAYCIHESCSGNGGYAVYFKIDGNKHSEAFYGIEEYLFINYSIVIDKSCKDVSRLRFVSFDPELYFNDKAKLFKKYLAKKEIQKKEYKQVVIKSDFDQLVNDASPLNLFDAYEDYLKLAFGLAGEFGEAGRQYFHSLCFSSSKYDSVKADKNYDTAIKREKTGITIASVYYKFKEAGLKLTSEKTERIKSIVKLSDNPTEALKTFGIEDTENIAQQFVVTKEKTEIDEIVDLIKLHRIEFNEITRNFEFNKINSDDRILARFYSSVWNKINDTIGKDKIWTLIQSRDNTPSFNPIHDFFIRNRNLITNNEFKKVRDCFEINPTILIKGEEMLIDDYLDVYLKKWLLGIIGSSFGTYSLMILVLIGEQGTKKTEFFRNLLPEELKKYYAESNLDEGKDSEILMCKKILIVDDEFGGKSKKDATKLKRLSSQQTFSIRAPYGRITEDLNRLAVLGGTSNDPEVINDPTGNRRIIPINLISFDLEKYKQIDKTKLFIELYNEWLTDNTGWFLTKNEIEALNQITIRNTVVSIEEEILSKEVVESEYGEMTVSELKNSIEGKFPNLRLTTTKIGIALKKLGHKQFIVRRGNLIKRIYKIENINKNTSNL